MEDSNPAYESAYAGNQANERNSNQIDNYDYMWNHNKYNYMWNHSNAVLKSVPLSDLPGH